MNIELRDLGIEIMAYVSELHFLTTAIKDLDETIIKGSNPNDLVLMQEIITRYKSTVDRLKILLEAYFFEESKEEEPVALNFRKLYKKLKQAY